MMLVWFVVAVRVSGSNLRLPGTSDALIVMRLALVVTLPSESLTETVIVSKPVRGVVLGAV